MKKFKITLLSLLTCLLVVGALNIPSKAAEPRLNTGTGWNTSASYTYNPGAFSVTYYGQAYFYLGEYSHGARIVVSKSLGTYSKSTDYVTSYGDSVNITCTFSGSNNFHSASRTVYAPL